MQFYILRVSAEPSVLGVRDGVTQAKLDKSGFRDATEFARVMKILGSAEYWNHTKDIDKLEFDLQCVKLLSKAKLTDFLLFSPHLMMCPFLISNVVRDFLADFKMHGVKLWKANVVSKAAEHAYSLIHITRLPDSVIDFSVSTFSVSNSTTGRTSQAFRDEEEKQAFEQKNDSVEFESIYFNESFDSSLDFFKLSNANIVVSDRLKVAMEAEKFSAVEFYPALTLKDVAPQAH
jgi:hypothetical protein